MHHSFPVSAIKKTANALLQYLLIILITTGDAYTQQLWQPYYVTPRTASQHLDLGGKWELSYMDTCIEAIGELADRKDPFLTTVPNSIHWSLYNAGKLPHPYYHKNSEQYRWTDEKAWYYSRSFDAPVDIARHYAFICFDGVDYFSRVWINDTLVGRHEGMFGGPVMEVSRLLKPGANKIVVEVLAGNWGQKADGKGAASKRPVFNSRATGRIIKPWVISGGVGGEAFFSVGMWQGVRLEIIPKVHLERPYLTTSSVSAHSAKLHLSVELFYDDHSLKQQLHPWQNAQIRHPNEKGIPFVKVKDKLSILVQLSHAGKVALTKEIPVTAYQGRNWVEAEIDLVSPRLWNPNGLGEPNLYQVSITLNRNGVATDKTEFDYGVRKIERVASAGPRTGDRYENWQFVINGKKLFVKGMNFTPQDILLETSEERYRWTLRAAKNMGVQMIRIWGGGLLETNTFYKLCNEMGLMVWQDFPIGNQDTPEYPQDIWEAQVVQNILRVRNHPSLVIWCGGNEFNPYSYGNAASVGIIERNLKTFDPDRMFLRTTPDAGSIHVYPDMDPTWYSKSYGKEPWISETGMHSMPDASLFYETVDSSEFKGLGRMWDTDFGRTHPEFIHHFTEYGPSRVPRMLSRASHIDNMNDPSIESVTEATQVGAGEFYQVVSEKTQANFPVTTGLMPWVFKRHWPVIAIQMLDWFGNAGAPYYFLKRTYETTHAALDIERMLWAPGEQMKMAVKVTNASMSTLKTGHSISLTVYDDTFRQLYSEDAILKISDAPLVSSHSFANYKIPSAYRNRYLFIVAELRDAQKKLVSRSFYYPRVVAIMEDQSFYKKYINEPIPWVTFDKGPWLKPTVAKTATTLSAKLSSVRKISEQESVVVVKLTNTGSNPAFMAKIDVEGTHGAVVASDNYLWLNAGENREITMNVLWHGKQDNAFIRVNAWNAPVVNLTFK